MVAFRLADVQSGSRFDVAGNYDWRAPTGKRNCRVARGSTPSLFERTQFLIVKLKAPVDHEVGLTDDDLVEYAERSSSPGAGLLSGAGLERGISVSART